MLQNAKQNGQIIASRLFRRAVKRRGLPLNAIYSERNGASHRSREATFSRQKPAASAVPLTTFGSKVDGIGLPLLDDSTADDGDVAKETGLLDA